MQKLSDVTIVAKNDYACVTVVSLDDKPIATSRRILAQIGTIARPTGWKEKPMRIPTKEGILDGSRIVDVGGPPWRIEKMRGALGCQKPLHHQGHHPRPQRNADLGNPDLAG